VREFSAPGFHSWLSFRYVFRSFFHVPCINRPAIDVTCVPRRSSEQMSSYFSAGSEIMRLLWRRLICFSLSSFRVFPISLLFSQLGSLLFLVFRRVPATWLQVLYGNGGFSLEHPLTEINLNRYAARVALSTWPWVCQKGVEGVACVWRPGLY